MKSGRGKCPQCKEMIVVDLEAPEIRCPFCNALLKKSAKTVAEVRAENEAREAAAKARMAALEEEATPAEEIATAAPAEDIPAPVVEEASATAPVAEETPIAEETAAPEAATETVDEIGLSDEELAAMDETASDAFSEENATEPAQEEAVDEIGLTDEELAMMDEAPNDALTPEETSEDAVAEEVVTEDAPQEEAPAQAEEPLVFGSIAATDEGQTEDAVEEESEESEEAEDASAEDDFVPHDNIEFADDIDPALVAEENAAVEPLEEVSEEQSAPETAESEAVSEEETPVTEEAAQSDETEDALEPASEDLAPAEGEPYVPTEEDMAFAASLSEGTRKPATVGFVKAVSQKDREERQAKQEAQKKRSEEEAQKEANPHEGFYKRPVAIAMAALSFLACVLFFLCYRFEVFGLISESLGASISEKISMKILTLLGAKAGIYVSAAFFGLIGIVAILGMTGKKGKISFLLVLIADVIHAVLSLWEANEYNPFFFTYEEMPALLEKYAIYVEYLVCALLLVAGILFMLSLAKSKEDFAISGKTTILPFVFLGVVTLGYLALVVLPIYTDFSVSANILRYAVIAVWVATILLTLVGVHNAKASRGANAWLTCTALMVCALTTGIFYAIEQISLAKLWLINLCREIPYAISPVIALFGLIGFTVSDARN